MDVSWLLCVSAQPVQDWHVQGGLHARLFYTCLKGGISVRGGKQAAGVLEMLDSPRTVPGWAVVSQDFACCREGEMPADVRSSLASSSSRQHGATRVCCMAPLAGTALLNLGQIPPLLLLGSNFYKFSG